MVEHRYTSTACQHGLHDRCRQVCKFCPALCECSCHVAYDPVGAVISRHPEAFDERQRPVCGVWGPLGPCVCGNPEGHATSP